MERTAPGTGRNDSRGAARGRPSGANPAPSGPLGGSFLEDLLDPPCLRSQIVSVILQIFRSRGPQETSGGSHRSPRPTAPAAAALSHPLSAASALFAHRPHVISNDNTSIIVGPLPSRAQARVEPGPGATGRLPSPVGSMPAGARCPEGGSTVPRNFTSHPRRSPPYRSMTRPGEAARGECGAASPRPSRRGPLSQCSSEGARRPAQRELTQPRPALRVETLGRGSAVLSKRSSEGPLRPGAMWEVGREQGLGRSWGSPRSPAIPGP